MIFNLKINGVPTLFIKAFSSADAQDILEFVRKSALFYSGASSQVLFIDTPITSAIVEAVEKLLSEGIRVVFRDHHGIDGEPHNDRDKKVAGAIARLRSLLADDCVITVRRLHPACSTLVSAGEFKDAIAIIADPDADGLTAAMKAAGISYEGLDDDAAKLDGEPQLQITGTAISQLLAKGIATIPSYDPSKPKEREQSHKRLFGDFVKAVSGDMAARQRLEDVAQAYEQAVGVSHKLASTAVSIAPGVVMVDVANSALFDPGTLHALVESDQSCRILVLRKSLGPIAAVHGIQYSLSVPKAYQSTINLQSYLPGNTKSDPETGIISNVSFLLHVSPEVWTNQILPKLR